MVKPKIEFTNFNPDEPEARGISLSISGLPISLDTLPEDMSKHGVAIANIILASSVLERSFQDLLAAIMKGANENQSHIIMEQVQWRAKEKIIEACSETRNTPIVNKILKGCLGKGGVLGRAKRRRNEVAHGQWCVFEGIDGLILTALDGNSKDRWLIYSLRDHEQSLEWLKEANRTMWDLILCYQQENPCDFLRSNFPKYL